jgi:hypothetical protein
MLLEVRCQHIGIEPVNTKSPREGRQFSTTNRQRSRNPAVFCGIPAVGSVTVGKLGEARGLVKFGAPKIEDAVRADIIFLALPFAAIETFGPVERRDKIWSMRPTSIMSRLPSHMASMVAGSLQVRK